MSFEKSFKTEKPRIYPDPFWNNLKQITIHSKTKTKKYFYHTECGLVVDVRQSIPEKFKTNKDYKLLRLIGCLDNDGKLILPNRLGEDVIDWCYYSDIQINKDDEI